MMFMRFFNSQISKSVTASKIPYWSGSINNITCYLNVTQTLISKEDEQRS